MPPRLLRYSGSMPAALMTRPHLRAIIAGSTALHSKYGTVRFSLSVNSQKASSKSTTGRGSALLPMPALLTRISTGPSAAAALAARWRPR